MKFKKGVLIQKLGEQFVAYDNETSTLHELNEVGYFILEHLEKGEDRKKIIRALKKNYDVSRKKAEEDVDNFLKELEKKDLIVEKK